MQNQFQILFFISLVACTLNINKKCDCTQLTQQKNCLNSQCLWIIKQENQYCDYMDYYYSCIYYNNEVECDSLPGCALTNEYQCDLFTKCSDYKVKKKNANKCQQKDSSCYPGIIIGNDVECINETITCSQITDPDVCKGLFLNNNIICWWSNTCLEYDYTQCSTITDSSLCQYLDCVYKDGQCSAPTCESQSYSKCTNIRGNNYEEKQLCQWNSDSSTCIEIIDYSLFNQSDCYKMTLGTYEWNDNVCDACQQDHDNDNDLGKKVGVPIGVIGFCFILGIIIYCIYKKKKQQEEKERRQQEEKERRQQEEKERRQQEEKERRQQQYAYNFDQVLPSNQFLNVQEDQKCLICMNPLKRNEEVKETQCGHYFHKNCLFEQMKSDFSKKCPKCHTIILP